MTNAEETRLLRHTVATLAYRAAKVLRDFPRDAAATRVSPGTRTPLELLAHLGDLLEWAERFTHGQMRWAAAPAADWDAASARFFRALDALDAALAKDDAESLPAAQIFQGPIADALTHVGQLAMLRGMLGSALRPESYARADIRVGSVGARQSPPALEFDGDASKPRPKSE